MRNMVSFVLIMFSSHFISENFVFHEELSLVVRLPLDLIPWEAGVGYFEDFLFHDEPQIPTK
jgi:hypothetical protein